MIKTKHELQYCLSCGIETDPDKNECECGSKNLVYGKLFKFSNKKIFCACGEEKFRMTLHLNRSPYYNKTYQCQGCGNVIGMQTYAENPYVD